MESTKRGGKVCGWCSVLLKSQRKVGGFARWVGVYGRWQLLANRAYKTKWNGKLNRNRKTQMANDSLRTLTQKQSGTVSKESQFIVTDIDFYSGPIPIPFPFFSTFFFYVVGLIMRLLSSQLHGIFGGCPSPRESRNNWHSGISHACHRQSNEQPFLSLWISTSFLWQRFGCFDIRHFYCLDPSSHLNLSS